MTNAEAKAILETNAVPVFPLQIEYQDWLTAMHMALEALEKQTPKKPYGTNGNWANLSMNRCPYCKTYPLNPKDDYCPNCGQALDWEEEE